MEEKNFHSIFFFLMDIHQLSEQLAIVSYNSIRSSLLSTVSDSLSKDLKLSPTVVSAALEKALPSLTSVSNLKETVVTVAEKNSVPKKEASGTICTHTITGSKDPEKNGKPCNVGAKWENEKGEPRCAKHKPKTGGTSSTTTSAAVVKKAPAKKSKANKLSIPEGKPESSIGDILMQDDLKKLLENIDPDEQDVASPDLTE